MLKNKLVAAGILSLGALSFGAPAMAGMGFGNRSYSGRYACHEDDGAGTQSPTNVVGGVTATYVVQPNGMGSYNGGELVVNASALWGDDPCTFELETSGEYESTYSIDSSGIVHETLNWSDDSMDACAGDYFTQNIEASLSLPNAFGAANQTKTTSNINITVDEVSLSFAGTGECVSSAN